MSKGKRNRAKSALTKKTPSSGEDFSPVIEQKLVAEQFLGPLPHPNILEGYEKLLPGTADRIISMAEIRDKASPNDGKKSH